MVVSWLISMKGAHNFVTYGWQGVGSESPIMVDDVRQTSMLFVLM